MMEIMATRLHAIKIFSWILLKDCINLPIHFLPNVAPFLHCSGGLRGSETASIEKRPQQTILWIAGEGYRMWHLVLIPCNFIYLL
ncbi:hypothetical protein D3C75_562220 [compost metagenome]